MDKLTKAEVCLQNLLNMGDYQKAKELLTEKKDEISPIHQVIFISSIAFAEGEEEKAWEQIKKGLEIDGSNYELYFMLGEYYLTRNSRQAYLCYENALFYCRDSRDKEQIRLILDELGKQEVYVPKAAIVILSYNLLTMTKECIESIRQTTPENAREIIVVDNASDDGSIEWLKKQTDIKLLCNTENAGFPKGCNQGIELAKEDADIFLLNNDTLLTPNALFWLRMGLYENERNGSAGCVSNYVSNFQAVIENGKSKKEYIEFAKKTNIPMKNPYLNKVHLVGFALLIKRKVLNKTGLLDERFSPGNYEDNDICLRIALEGYRNVLCKNSFIIHWGSMSFGKAPQSYRTIMQRNCQKFFDKWEEIGLYPEDYLDIRAEIVERICISSCEETTIAVIGTGDGSCLSYLQNKFPFARVYGIEQQYYLAKLADAITDTVRMDLNDWKSDDFQETFDIVIVNDILKTAENPKKALYEISRMLKKDGKIFISFNNSMHFSRIFNPSVSNKFFSKNEMVKMLSAAQLSVDNWIYMQVECNEEKLAQHIVEIRKQLPSVSEEDLRAYQWIVVARLQRDDICFGNKMAVCIPTYEHPEVIEDVLSHCAETYKRYGLDVYYYDSSRDERTKQVIERYQKEGYDNLYCIKLDSELQVYEKEEKIYQLEGLQKKYMYLWLIADRRWCNENTLQLMYRAVSEKHDLVFLDVGHQNCGKEYSICSDANEFYHRCGDYATSMDVSIYHVDSMLELDINEFTKLHPKGIFSFLHFQVIFEQLSKKKRPDIVLLAGEDVVIYHSRKCGSGWSDRRIDVWGKQWIDANEELPDCYDNKEDVIKRTASFPWLLGSVEPLIELHEKGILTPEYYEEIKDWWERVSVIELETLKKIAYGEYE